MATPQMNPTGQVTPATGKLQPTNYGALTTLITVFFFWGFIAAGNSVFIPFCKHYFNLDQFQSQLIDFAFYLAYYIGALILFAYGAFGGRDLVAKWGYKRSIVYGLLFSALGAAVMILAVYGDVFVGMLGGLFVVALGFSLQQVAANPFAIMLGDPTTGASRVNLGGGINSFGTMIGPLIVAFALFGTTAAISDDQIASLSLGKVIVLYTCVGLLFLAAAALFYFSKKVPAGINTEKSEKETKTLNSLLIMTGLLIIMFVPVFSSYNSTEQATVQQMEGVISDDYKKVDQLVVTGLGDNPTNISTKNFLKDKTAAEIESQIALLKSNASEDVVAEVMTLKSNIDQKTAELNAVKLPLERYRMMWLFGALASVVFSLLIANFRAKKNPEGWGAMRYPQLVLGMLALFLYVGAEVTIVSNLGELINKPAFGAYSTSEAALFISMYWGSLMIGRWVGSISAFEFKKSTKKLLTFIVPLIAFAIVLSVNKLSGYKVHLLYCYIICVGVQIGAFFLSGNNPARTLLIFGLLGITAMAIGIFSTGLLAVYAFISGGLFCSIMWPAIFTLSIAGLGKYTTQGSAFLVMMILGGGVLPPIQGKLADLLQSGSDIVGYGIHQSYWIPLLAFGYITLYAFLVKGILRKQGITYDTVS
ncbi:MAG: MFS transporter [Chitinophagaceae bacterium]|nr:MFS transporter [Chitinophagaceae bacterium]